MRISDWSSDVCSSDLRSGRQPIPLWNSRIVHDIQRLADLGLSSFNLASDMSRYNSGDTITRWPDDGADLMSEGHDISPERARLVGGAAIPYDQLPFFGREAGCLRRKCRAYIGPCDFSTRGH